MNNSALHAHAVPLHKQAGLTPKPHREEEPNKIVFPNAGWQRKAGPGLGSAPVKFWVALRSAVTLLST